MPFSTIVELNQDANQMEKGVRCHKVGRICRPSRSGKAHRFGALQPYSTNTMPAIERGNTSAKNHSQKTSIKKLKCKDKRKEQTTDESNSTKNCSQAIRKHDCDSGNDKSIISQGKRSSIPTNKANQNFDIDSDSEMDSNLESSLESGSKSGSESELDSDIPKVKRKKYSDDGSQSFANAVTAIIGSKLKAYDRNDPILARNKTPIKKLESAKLEAKARRALVADKKLNHDKFRIKNLIPMTGDEENVRNMILKEREMKKIAQKGVVRLFNAILSTQIRTSDDISKESLGYTQKEELITKVSKQTFLDLVQAAGND